MAKKKTKKMALPKSVEELRQNWSLAMIDEWSTQQDVSLELSTGGKLVIRDAGVHLTYDNTGDFVSDLFVVMHMLDARRRAEELVE